MLARPTSPPLWSLLLTALVCVGLTACANARKVAKLRGADSLIRKVEFEGVERFDAKQLHEHMALRPTKWIPPRKQYYYPGLIPSDAERIAKLYRAHGYYEAEVVDVRVETIERSTGLDRVNLVFVVEEGPVTTIEELVVHWSEGAPQGPPAKQRRAPFSPPASLDPHEISERISLAKGDAFEVPAVRSAARTLRDHLRYAGFPYAEVIETATVDRDARTAKVELDVRPGRFMTIGSVSISGLHDVPREEVENELDDIVGEPFSPALLELSEQRAYGLDVFSTATATLTEPASADPDQDADTPGGRVGVEVEVRERDPQRVRLGVGLGFETNRWEQRASARYTHANLFHDLYKISLTAEAGYAELPNLIDIKAHGPVASLDLHGEKKGLLEDELVWTIDPGVEVGIQQGYEFFALDHRFGVSRFFTRWFELELGHSLRYVNFYSTSPSLRDRDTFLGLDFHDPYVVSHVHARATVFAVDQISSPNDGAILRAEYRVAGGPFGGDYDFHELATTVRGYWRPLERLQFGLRARVGVMFPYGKQPGAPIDMRRYLGGAETVRGWGLRRLSPRIEDCPAGQPNSECESIPVGGLSSVLGNFEVRVRTWKQLWAAAFIDLGDVQPGVTQFVPSEWNYSSGAGLRYDTPVGKIRFDVGFRLNDTPLSQGEPIWALHLGLGESF